MNTVGPVFDLEEARTGSTAHYIRALDADEFADRLVELRRTQCRAAAGSPPP